MTRLVTGELFKKMITNAAAAIENNKQEINELNVFPVPDGDTGTNMSLTIGAAEKALAEMTQGTISHAADITANAMLRGARGNSGVILSLLFRGFSRRLKDVDSADAVTFADALVCGVEAAYKAVMKPTEGTILTVSRLAAGTASAASEQEDDLEYVFERALSEGNIALAQTIEQNPVLKKAGVIDAGAKGYLYIFDGMLKAMYGESIAKISAASQPLNKADFTLFTAEDIKFMYCTEFIVSRNNKNDINHLRDFLGIRGDSLVVVDDDEIIKVHVHTNEPGVVLTEALTYGHLMSVKIDNMHQQHSETLIAVPDQPPPAADEPAELKNFGTVVVCAGFGLEEVFQNLGADKILTGGQTMNPSTEDILEKINATPSQTVFVLPNNKNIIMAAQQCVAMTDKRVIVIPTKSIPQGVSAMLAIEETGSVEGLAARMTEAAERVHTALVTLASRDSVYDGYEIKEGEYLALIEDSLAASGPDAAAVIDEVAVALSVFSPEFITIFFGEDVSEPEATDAASRISAAAPGVETSLIYGGQPVYHYIISAE